MKLKVEIKKNTLIGDKIPYGKLYDLVHGEATRQLNLQLRENETGGIVANEFIMNKDKKTIDVNVQIDTWETPNNSTMEDFHGGIELVRV